MALVFDVMHLCKKKFIAFVHSFFNFFFFFPFGIDKSTEWSTIPVCPSLMRFFLNRDDTKGTNSSKILCWVFVYFLFKFVRTDFVVLG